MFLILVQFHVDVMSNNPDKRLEGINCNYYSLSLTHSKESSDKVDDTITKKNVVFPHLLDL